MLEGLGKEARGGKGLWADPQTVMPGGTFGLWETSHRQDPHTVALIPVPLRSD